MTRVFELVTGLSSIVKVGWILWLTWGVAQIYWYFAAREWDSAPAVDDRAAGWPPLRAEDVVATRVAMFGLLAGVTRWPAGSALTCELWIVIQPVPVFTGNVNDPVNTAPACRVIVSPGTASFNTCWNDCPDATYLSMAKVTHGCIIIKATKLRTLRAKIRVT